MKQARKNQPNAAPNNVLQFPDIAPKPSQIMLPRSKSASDYRAFIIENSVFGYPPGTIFMGRENFTKSEISRTTLVITSDGEIVTGQTKSVRAVIDFIQIDVRGANE